MYGVRPFKAYGWADYCHTPEGKVQYPRHFGNTRGYINDQGKYLIGNLFLVSSEGYYGPYIDILECEAQLEHLKDVNKWCKWEISKEIRVQNFLGDE